MGRAVTHGSATWRPAPELRREAASRPQPVGAARRTGAALVVEIRAPGDQTYDKIDFYAELGVREVLIVPPLEQRVELLRLVDSRLLLVTSEGTGAVRSDVLGASFATVESALRISWGDGSADLC